ncbi:MAG: (Fe-S)-binding protein, partial [Chloroflexota bacterium]
MTTHDVREDTTARPRAGFSGPDAPLEEDIYKCVHCGFYLQACPTYLETGLEAESPRGRIALMRAVYEGRAEINEQVVSHWDLCLQCRACEVACPSGVPYGRMMEATRSQVEQTIRRGFKERTARRLGFQSILPDNRRLDLVGKALRLYQRSGLRGLARRSGILKFIPGGSLERNLPRLSDKFFTAQGQVIRAQGERRARVTLLAGCVMRLTHADTLDAVTRVLARNGVE